MKQERVILSFIMVLIGLLVAGTAFYFYQSSNKTPVVIQAMVSPTPTNQKDNDVTLVIDNPNDESVAGSKDLIVSGKTNPKATVLVITDSDQQVLTSSEKGDFKTTLTINNDQNLITIISILPSGESKQVQKTVTYSTSNF
jgi:hypothetical protein